MRSFTSEGLSGYGGANGEPIYVACRGKVYDVSRSFLWKKGRHQAMHGAGRDLTEGLAEAPHGIEMLERFPVVGVFEPTD